MAVAPLAHLTRDFAAFPHDIGRIWLRSGSVLTTSSSVRARRRIMPAATVTLV